MNSESAGDTVAGMLGLLLILWYFVRGLQIFVHLLWPWPPDDRAGYASRGVYSSIETSNPILPPT